MRNQVVQQLKCFLSLKWGALWQRCLWLLMSTLALGALPGLAHAGPDLVVTRAMPATSGPTASRLVYEVAYKNAGPGAADGAQFTEQLPAGFSAIGVTCLVASGGASCPGVTQQTNPPTINGVIGSFPEFAVVRLRVEIQLSSREGRYELRGSIAGGSSDPQQSTNQVLSSIYVRPLLLDLATSYSSSLSMIGGSGGVGGNVNPAPLHSDAVAAQMPISVSYLLKNNGPDAAPGGAFMFLPPIGGPSHHFLNYVSTDWIKSQYGVPIGVMEPPDGFGITAAILVPFTCQATGATPCPAPVLYLLSSFDGYSRWLDQPPKVIPTPSNLNVSYAFIVEDMEILSPANLQLAGSPLLGRDLGAGDGLILTATLRDASSGNGYLSLITPSSGTATYSPEESMLTPTSQIQSGKGCNRNPGEMKFDVAVSYSNIWTGKSLGAVADADLGNNSLSATINGERTCATADVTVEAAPTALTPVTPGQPFSVSYIIKNQGASLPGGIRAMASTYIWDQSTFPVLPGWDGDTVQISCTTTGSPCPSQAKLDAWLAQKNDAVFDAPMDSGTNWTIVMSGTAGLQTACGNDVAWNANLRIQPVDMALANGYETSGQNPARILFDGASCPPNPGLSRNTRVVTTIDPPSRTSAIGDMATYTMTVTNQSGGNATLKQVSMRGADAGSSYANNGSWLNSPVSPNAALSPFGPIGGTPTGLPMRLQMDPTSIETTMVDSGIVCSASPGAECPTELYGLRDAKDGFRFRYFSASIPVLPDGGYVTFTVPWLARGTDVGCVPANANQRGEKISAEPSGFGTVNFNDGTPELQQSQTTFTYASASAYAYIGETNPCPTGTLSSTVTKKLNGHTGVPDASIANQTNYASEVMDGEMLAYDLTLTNTGTVDIRQFHIEDSMNILCRDGNSSYDGTELRCGNLVARSISCTPQGGASCPAQADLDQLIVQQGSQVWQSYMLYGLLGKASVADPALVPVGKSLVLTLNMQASGVNTFTGALSTRVDVNPMAANLTPQSPDTVTTAQTLLELPFAAGIALSKSVDKLQAAEGELVTYTLDITNGGNGVQAAGVRLTDPLPANVSAFTSVTCVGLKGAAALPDNGAGVCPANADIVNDGNGVSALLPAMQPNTMLRFIITANAPVGGIITSVDNEAHLIVPTSSVPSTLRASANFAIPSKAETAAALVGGFKSVRNASGGSAAPKPGDQLIYTISYANQGGMDVPSFQITDTLPAQLTYSGGGSVMVSGAMSVATFNTAFDGASTNALLASGAVLGAGGAITITLPVTVNAGVADGTVVANQASGSGSGISGALLSDNVDNTNPVCPATAPAPCLPAGVTVPAGSAVQTQTVGLDATSVTVGQTPVQPAQGQLQIGVTVDHPQAAPGGTLSYSVTISNTGTVNATGVPVNMLLPPELVFVSASDGGSNSAAQVNWSVDIPAGGSRTFTVVVRVAAGTQDGSQLIASAGLQSPSGFATAVVKGACASDASRSCAITKVVVGETTEPSAVQPVPTLGEWAVMLLSTLLAGLALIRVQRLRPM